MTWRKTLPSWVPIRIKTPFCISDPTSMAEKVSNIYSYRNIWHMSKQNHFKLWFYLFVPTAVKGYLYIWIYWLGEYFRIHRLLIKHWSQITWYQTKKTTKYNWYKDKTFTFHFKSWFLLVISNCALHSLSCILVGLSETVEQGTDGIVGTARFVLLFRKSWAITSP